MGTFLVSILSHGAIKDDDVNLKLHNRIFNFLDHPHILILILAAVTL